MKSSVFWWALGEEVTLMSIWLLLSLLLENSVWSVLTNFSGTPSTWAGSLSLLSFSILNCLVALTKRQTSWVPLTVITPFDPSYPLFLHFSALAIPFSLLLCSFIYYFYPVCSLNLALICIWNPTGDKYKESGMGTWAVTDWQRGMFMTHLFLLVCMWWWAG